MRAVIQRVSRADVVVEGETVGAIERGLLVYLGAGADDGQSDVDYVAQKIRGLRVFVNEEGKMSRSVEEVHGAVLVVSQFTLYGDVRQGRRPSFSSAAPPELAERLYEDVVAALRAAGLDVATGTFPRQHERPLRGRRPRYDPGRQPPPLLKRHPKSLEIRGKDTHRQRSEGSSLRPQMRMLETASLEGASQQGALTSHSTSLHGRHRTARFQRNGLEEKDLTGFGPGTTNRAPPAPQQVSHSRVSGRYVGR
jgi:D-tyrosyl-tRNA(Tyr) deacylase